MTTIHHMVLKQAARAKVSLLVLPDGKIEGRDLMPHGVTAVGADPKAVLERVLQERQNITDRAKAALAAEKMSVKGEVPPAKKTAETTNPPDPSNPIKGMRRLPGAIKGSVVPGDYQEAYKQHGGTCGDDMANALKEAVCKDGRTDVKLMVKVAQDNGIDLNRWSHLNVGQIRMNLGNVLRNMVRKGHGVKVGGHTFTLQQPRPKDKGEK